MSKETDIQVDDGEAPTIAIRLDQLATGGVVMKGTRINPHANLLSQVVRILDRSDVQALTADLFLDFQEGVELDPEQLYNDIIMLNDLHRAERFRRSFAEQCKMERVGQRNKILGAEAQTTMMLNFGLKPEEMSLLQRERLDSYAYTVPQMDIDIVKASIGNQNPKRPLYSLFEIKKGHPQENAWLQFIAHDIKALEAYISLKDKKFTFLNKILAFCNDRYKKFYDAHQAAKQGQDNK